MRKFLFLLGSYLPNPSPNGICAQQVINQILNKGDKVTCIAYNDQGFPDHENIGSTNVYRINRGLAARILAWSNSCKDSQVMKYINRLFSWITRAKQIALIPLYPWVTPFYTFKLFNLATKLHEENRFDAVICVHMPLDTLIVGYLMKSRYPELKYVPYFLDSLSGGFSLRILPRKWAMKRKLRWEKMLLKKADLSISMQSSYEHHLKYSRTAEHLKNMVFLDIPLLINRSGHQEACKCERQQSKDTINVLYTGSLFYNSRNPSFVLELFKRLYRKDISLTIVGESDCVQLFSEMDRLYDGELNYYGHVPHDEVQGQLSKADFFLNIGVSNPNAISGKIFEYMSYGKPIISTYRIDDEPCIPYLTTYHPALLIDERSELDSQVAILNEFIDKYRSIRVDSSAIMEKFYRNTPDAFVKELYGSMEKEELA